jgi:hypothetical protein
LLILILFRPGGNDGWSWNFPRKRREEEEFGKGVALSLLISQFFSGLAKTLARHGVSEKGGTGGGGI